MADLWEYDDVTLEDLGINLPEWITDTNLTPADVAAINQGGCASGAYMEAVAYSDAQQTMADYGDAVLTFIEEALGEIPELSTCDISWSGMACFYLSIAVELWCSSIEYEVNELLTEREEAEEYDE